MIRICNLRREKPSQPYDFKVDRSSPLGNPFPMKSEADRERVCDEYDHWFGFSKTVGMHQLLNKMLKVYQEYGKLRLFCWCAPKRCHAETIADYLQEEALRGKDYVCTICKKNLVSPVDGEDTCYECLRRI